MKRFIEGADRNQVALLPECLDDYISEDNPVRAVDAFVEELDLKQLGFAGADPAMTGRPAVVTVISLPARLKRRDPRWGRRDDRLRCGLTIEVSKAQARSPPFEVSRASALSRCVVCEGGLRQLN